MDKNTLKGYVFAVTAAIIWGVFFLVAKAAVLELAVFNLIAFRYILACLPFWLLIFLKREKIELKTIIFGIVLGLTLFVADFFQLSGIALTTVSASALLSQGLVLFTPLLLLVIGRRVQKLDFIRAAIALAGIYLFVVKESIFSVSRGNVFILLFAVFISAYFVLNERFVKEVKLKQLLAVQFLTEGITALVFTLIFVGWRFPSGFSWLPILYLGFIATSVAWGLNSFAQKVISSPKIVIVYVLEPVVGGFLAFLFFEEVLTLKELAGAGMILFALILPIFKKNSIK